MRKFIAFSIVLFLVLAAAWTGALLYFIFLYPLFMAFMWMIGGTYFYYRHERHNSGPEIPPLLPEYPFVSILIPCFNEGKNVEETVAAACQQNWPDFEVIAINDGSGDDTGNRLLALTAHYPRLRVVNLAKNQGKAIALRMGALVARGEYFICVDGDAMLHPNVTAFLIRPLLNNPRVGAVTGNPRIRTRSTFIGKIQVGEFSSIIGMIKRAQRVYGLIFTVSGVISAFRRTALHSCGYWDPNMITEDIDISWALQLKHWQIQYEPNALCWILMPETLRGLHKQRVRWAQGGAEVFFKYLSRLWVWQDRRMWLIAIDYVLSVSWAYCFLFSVVLWALGMFYAMPPAFNVPTIFPPAFWGLILATVNLIQCFVAIFIERRYEPKLPRLLVWSIWYPICFWLIIVITTIEGFPRALLKHESIRGLWNTTDRGFH